MFQLQEQLIRVRERDLHDTRLLVSTVQTSSIHLFGLVARPGDEWEKRRCSLDLAGPEGSVGFPLEHTANDPGPRRYL
jgi:hypothetical protein